ncbi:hypothetical protein [Dermabacter hominis]|uniref:hypothetical protein n=1 Tax=Dermabacter hominis TaxID=36740 RepID=UPI00223A9120|nr:hypothetical protein [Dermabacter hominis]MCT2025107.1 hypothetical protein [Dermabacter hominis]
MTAPQANPLKKIAALMLIPFMLVVAGCGKLEATVNIENPEKVTIEGVANFKKSVLDEAHVSTDEFCGEKALEEFAKNTKPKLKVEEKGDEVVCTFSAITERKEPMGDALKYDKESDTYTYHEDSKGSFGDQVTANGFKVDVTFVFPGKVTESSVGKIDGNKVHITDTKEYFSDITIKAEGSSFPWLIVIIVVVVALLLVLAAVVIGALVFMKRKKKSGAGDAHFQQQGSFQSSTHGGAQPQGQQAQPGAQPSFGQHPSQGSSNAPQPPSYQAPQQGSYEAPQQGQQPPHQGFQENPFGGPGNQGPQDNPGQTFGKQ